MSKKLFTIAFDLGGVIFAKHNDNRFFKKNYLETNLSVGIYDVIISLSKDPTNKLIIISKAFPPNAKRSKEILDMYDLTQYFNSVIFCEENSAKYHIAKAMNVDLMIDDKLEVLDPFDSSISTFLYNDSTSGQLMSVIYNLRKSFNQSL